VNLLARIPSIKLKLGIVIVAGVVATIVAMVVAKRLDIYLRWGVLASGLLALIVIQLLARGMTRPLREMAAAAKAMARGQHGQTVEVKGNDEVAQLAEAFNAMSREIAETDRMRRELVANVSHELRTPISAVQASLENLIDGVQPADPETLQAMHAQLERLGTMVEQLLDLSRMEAEGIGLKRSEFPAERLLKRAREEALISGAGQAGIEVAASPGDLRIVADEERLQQVVNNLVDNALRYSPSGEPIRAGASARGGIVRLDVTDGGPGIPAAERAKVFERFYRVDRSRADGGAGLGLSIARWVVSMHGGSIWVEDAQPRGCRMVVELPDALPGGATRGQDG
jgi:signal transduction histidine kinase